MALLGRHRLLVLLCVVVAAAAVDVRAAGAQGDLIDEQQVKAAFLYNFAKFIQWPPSGRSRDLVVGIVGRSSFNEVLEEVLKGKAVDGREIVVRQVRDEDDAQAFHIIFIGADQSRRMASILERVGGAGVLTVGDTPHFLREGGIVRFYLRDNNVRFDINSVRATQVGLRISSQLLSLARQ